MTTMTKNDAVKAGTKAHTTPTTTLIPHLAVRGGRAAMAFYEKAFGAVSMMAMDAPEGMPGGAGKLMHGAMSIDGAVFFLCDEFPECGSTSPQTIGGSGVALHLQVADCDAVFERAVKAGCEVKMPLADMFWGDRYGVLKDPFGHCWSVATTKQTLTPEQIKAAMVKECGAGKG